MVPPAIILLFKTTLLFFLSKRTILESVIVIYMKFGSAIIRTHSLELVTPSQRPYGAFSRTSYRKLNLKWAYRFFFNLCLCLRSFTDKGVKIHLDVWLLIELEGFMNLCDLAKVGHYPPRKNVVSNNILFRMKKGNVLLVLRSPVRAAILCQKNIIGT